MTFNAWRKASQKSIIVVDKLHDVSSAPNPDSLGYISGMKKLLIAVLFVATVAAQAQEWKQMKTKDGKASVMIPEIPEMMTQNQPSEIGDVVMNIQILDMSAQGGDNMVLGLMSLEYPAGIMDSIQTKAGLNKFYDGAMNGAAQNSGGTISNQEEIEVNGHIGRKFSIELMGGMAVMTMKYVQVGQTGYIQQVISKGDAAENEEAKKFLSSFKIEEE